MEFTISPTVGVPIYQQLTEQICAAIARGRLSAGDRLPSVRELSQSVVVNPNTVARAYTELEREGVLYTRPGMGVFVAQARSPLPQSERRERVLNQLDRLLVDAVRYGFGAGELIDLVTERVKDFQWGEAPAGMS